MNLTNYSLIFLQSYSNSGNLVSVTFETKKEQIEFVDPYDQGYI